MFRRLLVRTVFGVLVLTVVGTAGAGDLLGIEGAPPIRFVENCGQWTDGSRFAAESGGARLRLTDDSMDLQLATAELGVFLRFGFVDSNPDVLLQPTHSLRARLNYFTGADPAYWVTDVATYRRVTYRELYPGLDLEVREGGTIYRYDLHVAPGADASQFVLRIEGADRVEVGAAGELVLQTELGELRHNPPIAFYADTGEFIPCHFEVRADNVVGFEVDARQPWRPFTIDPSLVMEWATTTGTSFGDFTQEGNCVDVDGDGIITIGGRTVGVGFATTPGSFEPSDYTQDTAVIAQFDPALPADDQLIYGTYLSSSWDDEITGLNVDDGVITACGTTEGGNFPTTPGAYDSTLAGEWDVFALRLDPSLFGPAQLLYSTYYGGAREDYLADPVYRDGKLYLVGHTRSIDIPLTADAYQTVNAGPISTFGTAPADSYVAVLDLALSGPAQLVYSSYFGGYNQWEVPTQVHVDDNGLITWTGRGGANLPTTPNAMAPTGTYPGGCLVQFDPSLNGSDQLVRSTYIGNGLLYATGMHVDPGGLITIAGWCEAPAGLVSIAESTIDPTYNGGHDGCVAQFDLSLPPSQQRVWGTYLGGTGGDDIGGMAVDELGRILVVGRTYSSDFPVVEGLYDFEHSGITHQPDGFFAEIDPTAEASAQLRASGFFAEQAGWQSLAIDAEGGYVALGGIANAAPIIGSVPFGSTSGDDFFVARLLQCDILGCCPPVADLTVTAPCDEPTIDVTWIVNGLPDSIDLWVENHEGVVSYSTTLPGDASSHVLEKSILPDETLRVFVHPQCSGEIFPPAFTDVWTYEGQSDIVVALEWPGNHDTVAIITDALIAHGRDVYTTHTLEDAQCFQEHDVENVWVILGAVGGSLSHSQGSFVYTVIQDYNKNVYLDGPSQFFDSGPPTSLLNSVDGVASALNMTSTQPVFDEVEGLDSGVGLDLSSFGTIGYTFDQSGFPETDRLTLAATEDAGSAIGPLWRHPATGFTLGVFYNSINGGKFIGQSFEFGGLTGDKTALIGAYLDAFALPEDLFWRGDCNGDGARDIGDVISLLNTLFGAEGFTCPDACDSNDSGTVDIGDAIVALAKLFSGGGAFPEPSFSCGQDPTFDDFRCAVQPTCP